MGRDDSGNVVENSLIKIPLEILSRGAKAQQKAVAKELDAVTSSLAELRQRPPEHKEAAAKELTRLLGRIQGLKRKLEGLDAEEDEVVRHASLRLERLVDNAARSEGGPPPSIDAPWSRERLDRSMAEHLAREGLPESAKGLAAAAGVEDMVDLEVILQSQPVVASLKAGDCGPALKWCQANKARLKKQKSSLESNLRLQEFVELVRADDPTGAISYARKHLAPAAVASDAGMATVRRYMGLLAFRKHAAVEPYKGLLQPQRWEELTAQFKEEEYALNAVPAKSLLILTLQAGLTCLKTTRCEELQNEMDGGGGWGMPTPDAETHCPACSPILRHMAAKLPLANRLRSLLVCPITGQVMDEQNPPLALPNGRVYSSSALLEMAGAREGQIECIATGETFDFSDLRKVFIS